MIPISISLSGFISYRELQTLSFTDGKLWVLSGPNGAGKSAIFDAITFVLFGVFRGQQDNYNDLINHQSDQAIVVFTFTSGENIYRAMRTIKFRKQTTITRQAFVYDPAETENDGFVIIPDTDSDKGFVAWVEEEIGLTWKTFTSAILLQQGRSDRLLDMNSKDRYEVLSGLIDLSRYVTLETRAKSLLKRWQDRLADLKAQLGKLKVVTDADLTNALAAIESAAQASIKTDAAVTELTEILSQASTWEEKKRQSQTLQANLTGYRGLLGREQEISDGFARLMDISRVLPLFEEMTQDRERLKESSVEQTKHEATLRELAEPLQKIEKHLAELNTQKSELQDEIEKLTHRKMTLADQISTLSPVVAKLVQIEAAEDEGKGLLAKLAEFSNDLDLQITDLSHQLELAEEGSNVIVWLKRISEIRNSLVEALHRRGVLEAKLTTLQESVKQTFAKVTAAESELTKASQTVSVASDKASQTRSMLTGILDRERRFGEVSGLKECRYCGSEMTPDHVEKERTEIQKEKARIEGQVTETEGTLTAIRAGHEAASAALKKYQAEHQAANTALETGRRDIAEVNREIDGQLKNLTDSYLNLPLKFRTMISAVQPADTLGWASTEYPSESDISQIEKTAGQKPALKIMVENLRKKAVARDLNKILLEKNQETLVALRLSLPADAETAKERTQQAEEEKGQADVQLQDLNASLRQVNTDNNRSLTDDQRYRQQKDQATRDIQKEKTRQEEMQDALARLIAKIPETWQAAAANLTDESLSGLRSESARLAPYEGLNINLNIARQNITSLEEQIGRLDTEIMGIPENSRRTANVVLAELDTAQKASTQAHIAWDQAREAHDGLLQTKNEHDEVDSRFRQAERKVYLYVILARKFGDKGIQQVLMRSAEVSIVNSANEMLHNLSNGRWQLGLRGSDDSKKALDLEVYDSKTGGSRPINIALASGSQRFRIAISLALAIGTYVRHESKRIESVIIDEGFGSLDKTGREDTIQELRSLAQHLEKIILVSHQEEFYEVFQTGYSIDIVDGASQVKLRGD